jgi:RHS repeat-associated protein
MTDAFDLAGRNASVRGPLPGCTATTYASSATYTPTGAIGSVVLGNSLAKTRAYNSLARPTSLTATAAGTSLLTLGWTYNDGTNNGNVMPQATARTSGLAAPLTETFKYADPANRLYSVAESGGSGTAPDQIYLYDAFGNRALRSGSWVADARATAIPGRQSTRAEPDALPTAQFTNNQRIGTVTYPHTYDGSVNLQAMNNSGTLFKYDAENHLATSNVAGNDLVTYAYDGEGRRLLEISGSGTTDYIYDAMGNVPAEVSNQTALVTRTANLTPGHLGSTRLITDSSAAAARCYDSAPFGEEIPNRTNGRTGCYVPAAYPESPDSASQKFTGNERDAETGLDYFGARYFSAAMGRFTSPDVPLVGQSSSNPQSWNLYSYGLNNPLRYNDPTGHDPEEPADPPQDLDCGKNGKDCGPDIKFKGTAYGTNIYVNGRLVQEAALDRDYGAEMLFLGAVRGIGSLLGLVTEIESLSPLWGLAPTVRGMVIEDALGGNLPRTFPVIDKFVDGVAKSIKSLDLRAATYLNPAKLESTLSGYVDKVANFNGATLKGVTVSAGEISGRVLEVAIPKGTATAAQQAAMARVATTAAQLGVKVVYVPIK